MTDAERLVEAETALHDLMTGTSARVVVERDGQRVEYTAINAGRLRAYIEELKKSIASDSLGANGPLRIVI